jgi:hypothetical protein
VRTIAFQNSWGRRPHDNGRTHDTLPAVVASGAVGSSHRSDSLVAATDPGPSTGHAGDLAQRHSWRVFGDAQAPSDRGHSYLIDRTNRSAWAFAWSSSRLSGPGSDTPQGTPPAAESSRPETPVVSRDVCLPSRQRNPPSVHPFVERLVGTMRREFLDHVLFWNARDLERKLADFQTYYNAARSHASSEGHTPLTFAGGHTLARAELNNVRWVSHCRNLVQLPVAA